MIKKKNKQDANPIAVAGTRHKKIFELKLGVQS